MTDGDNAVTGPWLPGSQPSFEFPKGIDRHRAAAALGRELCLQISDHRFAPTHILWPVAESDEVQRDIGVRCQSIWQAGHRFEQAGFNDSLPDSTASSTTGKCAGINYSSDATSALGAGAQLLEGKRDKQPDAVRMLWETERERPIVLSSIDLSG